MATDEITLTIPGERDFYGVAHLVLGGLATRHDLTIETFEDLLIALDGLLDRTRGASSVTLSVRVEDREIRASLGPFPGDALQRELERDSGGELGLRRLLDTVVDRYALDSRDDGSWVELTKAVGSANGKD